MSVEWKVSVQAIVRRAYDLEAISGGEYKFWNEQLSKAGFRNTEPAPIPLENPTLLNSLIDIHMNDLGYTTSELAEAMLMEEWEFEKIFLGKSGLRLVRKVAKPILRPFADGS